VRAVYALGFTIVGLLLGATFLVALAICIGLWLGVKGARPELLARDRQE